MRLKEQANNWAASNLLRKLDQPPERPKTRAKKNKRRWCGGKTGREHDYNFVKAWGIGLQWSWDYCYGDYECLNCGRKEYVQLVMEIIDPK